METTTKGISGLLASLCMGTVRRAAQEDRDGMAEARWFRVVYHDGKRARSLGRIAEVAPTRNTLDPFLSRLLLEGVSAGELLLVDERTRRCAIRRDVRPRRR